MYLNSSVNHLIDSLETQNDTMKLVLQTLDIHQKSLKSLTNKPTSSKQPLIRQFDINEEIDEDGRSRDWYVQELQTMNAKFDGDETLTELRNIYRLLQ